MKWTFSKQKNIVQKFGSTCLGLAQQMANRRKNTQRNDIPINNDTNYWSYFKHICGEFKNAQTAIHSQAANLRSDAIATNRQLNWSKTNIFRLFFRFRLFSGSMSKAIGNRAKFANTNSTRSLWMEMGTGKGHAHEQIKVFIVFSVRIPRTWMLAAS